MTTYSFTSQQQAWSNPPVDDIGYLSAEKLLELSNLDLKNLILRAQEIRYSGWRNHLNLWRDRLICRFGSFLHLKSFDYITNDDRYCVAILEPK